MAIIEGSDDTGYIFVYGTLKVNAEFNAPYRIFDKFRINVESAKVLGILYDFGYFPALIYMTVDSAVYGELHKYTNFRKVITIMDYIEGYIDVNNENNLFHRIKVNAIISGGREVKATAYEFARPIEKGTPSVVGGEWFIT
jgi:gamma-glutamylcyclotransferase (GGCT)/AIG2-like uncharacterized protein YtfP